MLLPPPLGRLRPGRPFLVIRTPRLLTARDIVRAVDCFSHRSGVPGCLSSASDAASNESPFWRGLQSPQPQFLHSANFGEPTKTSRKRCKLWIGGLGSVLLSPRESPVCCRFLAFQHCKVADLTAKWCRGRAGSERETCPVRCRRSVGSVLLHPDLVIAHVGLSVVLL
jgi:hypothetical protein